jgi:hypothetical protein
MNQQEPIDMPPGLTDEELNRGFTKYLQVRLLGLLALVDRPKQDEHFPMASGVVIETEGFYVLLTAAHYLRDAMRWKEEKRLSALFLLVHHESGICNPISLDPDEIFTSFCDVLDIGFLVLDDAIVADISKHGGFATRRDTLSMSPQAMKNFYLIGHASAYCQIIRETIATGQEGSNSIAWNLVRPGHLAVAISKLQFDGTGSDPGTFRFALINGFNDYSGASGGPIFGYSEGALIQDYSLVAIQSKQIRGAGRGQKPTHLVAASAAVAIHMVDEYLRDVRNSLSYEAE